MRRADLDTSFRRQSALIILLCGLVGLLALTFGWLAVTRFQATERAWEEYHQRADALDIAMVNLNQHLGYGGFIHNFKNLVLRRDLPRYQARIERDIADLTADLDQLEGLLISQDNKAATAQLRSTLLEYADKYSLIAPMIAAGKTSAEIDAAANVEDTQAFAALAQLAARFKERTLEAEKSAQSTQAEAMRFLQIGGLVIFASIIGALVALINYLRRIVAANVLIRQTQAQQQLMQGELVQAEKMAALGGLVAGVAHEINTPIGVALSSATYLEAETHKTDALYQAGELTEDGLADYFTTARQAAQLMTLNSQRASDLIHSFKQVAVDQTGGERRQYELATYLNEVLLSLRPLLKKPTVTVVVECPAGIVMDGFPGALAQVLTNLVMNSLTHAFDPEQAGCISIVVRPADTESEWVDLIYCDDGKGIPSALLNKVFEPFFTTRRGKGGSGLGLHIVFNIVRQTLKGTLTLDSQLGKGAVFTLHLPRRLPD